MGAVEAVGCVALGCVVIAVALLDLAVTALHPAAESQLSARFHRVLWFAVRYAARPLPSRARRALLGWTLPLSVAGLVLSWLLALPVGFALLALLVGFALLDAPSLTTPRAFARAAGAGPAPTPWGDALYFSGVCLTSIGFGDLTPRAGLVRAAAVAEGLAGLLVVGVAITYVLAVFPVLPQARVLARTLNEEADGQVDALPLVRRYLMVGATEPLAQRCRELATQLMTLTEAHTTHPILFYAHPARAELSFLRVLIVAQRLVAALRYGLRAQEHAGLVADPRVVGLEESLIAVLRTLGASSHPVVRPLGDVAAVVTGLCGEHAGLVTGLVATGLRGAGPAGRGEWEAYVRYRLATDPYIAAYAANSGYAAEDLWGPHPPLRGTTAPLPLTEADTDERDAAGA